VNTSIQHLIPADFAASSRVWVYQSNRLLGISEALQIEEELENFSNEWQSHGAPVKAKSFLFFGQFIVLMADETTIPVGGCSTDSSVQFIKTLEQKHTVSLLDRTQLAFIVNQKVQLLPLAQLSYAVEQNYITGDTLYFNNIVANKNELLHNWLIPVKNSWLQRRLTSNL
jgi:hypothetical protein